jgi:cell division protease FtsH
MAEEPRRSGWLTVGLPLLLLLVYLLLVWKPPAQALAQEIPYSEFKQLVRDAAVLQVSLSGDQVRGELSMPRELGSGGRPSRFFETRVPAMGDPELLGLLEEQGVQVRVEPPPGESGAGSLLLVFLPWLVLIGIYIWFWRRISRNLAGGIGRGGDVSSFLKPRASVEAKPPKVGFADVAGQENAKREVAELVDCLRNPKQYLRLGAEIPHGVLLMGPPGTGKTLLARALAGEAGVPFFSISASEFIEMFVGVGASRVRKLFDQAKAKAPSIIFIDELDSIGRVRGAGLGGGHDEREQTLNQILAEMDGFAGHEAVIVLAATNRPDVLDPALLRPGRFDRHVTLDLPDRPAREAILRLHTRQVPLDPEVDLGRVAAGTVGFSGADLKNLVNEAAMHAAREHRERVADEDFESMRDKVMLGSERTLAIQPEERHRLAVHESGHTLVAHYLPQADALHKVSIIPRGRALGATQQLPEEDRYTLPEEYLRDRLTVMLGGRSAERLVLGSVSSGADDDIHQATNLARAMVARWGMSDDIGPVDLRDSDEHPFLGREMAQPRHHSEATAKAVDGAVGKLLHEAQVQAEGLITQHRAALDRLVAELERKETLYREDIARILGGRTGETPAVARG